MADKGHGEETIATAFRVSTLVVRQRLRVANASPVILDAYKREEITLEQLMAYCLTDNHRRQEQVLESLKSYWNKGPEQIRRLLTEKSVPADDKRVRFIGIEAYLAAGGAIERDLFFGDDEGYLIGTDLVNRLVTERLGQAGGAVRAEGWAWVETAIDFPWNHRRDFRAIAPVTPALSEDEEAECENLAQEIDELESCAEDDLADEDSARLAEIKAKLTEFDARVAVYSEEQKAGAGAFVSFDHDGGLLVERGYRRYSDIAAEERETASIAQPASHESACSSDRDPGGTGAPNETGEPPAAANEDDSAELPDKLLTELTAYHSLGLRNALAADHRVAYLAVLHALVLDLFYPGYATSTCLQIDAKDTLVTGFPGLAEFKAAREIAARHAAFEKLLPENEAELWDALLKLDQATQEALFAHCAGLTVNALHEPWAGRSHKRGHALRLAAALQLDMSQQGFTATAANYLGRIKKQQILETVAEAKGEDIANLLSELKKKDMAAEAERLIADTGWLPEPEH